MKIRFTKFIRKNIFLILVLLLASFLRIIWVNNIPIGINGDELVYIETAKAISLTGKDFTGTWNPISAFIFKYPPNEMQAELPYFLQLLPVSILNTSLLSARLVNIILGTLTVYLIYLIALKLVGKFPAIITGFIAAINPWSVFISRTSYESPAAVFFYLLGLHIILSEKSKKILLAIIPFILAFYSYIGTKPVLIPFVALSVLYVYKLNNYFKLKKYLKVILLATVFISGFYFISIKSLNNSRVSDIYLPSSPEIPHQVDLMRSIMINNKFQYIFINKYTYYVTIILTKLLNIFSTNYLFLNGDIIFAMRYHGLFYFVDALFIILGLVFLYSKNKHVFVLICSLVFIGTWPQLIHHTFENFSQHVALMIPFMIILIGTGIAGLLESINNHIPRHGICIIIILIYSWSLLNFFNLYVYLQPRLDYFDFDIRVLSHYLDIANRDNIPVTLYSSRSFDIFKKYLFYSKALNSKTIKIIQKISNKDNLVFGTITFTGCNTYAQNGNNIVIFDSICGLKNNPQNFLNIRQQSDGGEKYIIYNDKVCNNIILNKFSTGLKLSDFNIENTSKVQYCQNFINTN
jgi:4-amino-4-deoxy-L-arabinose transferase-like glycosyltransferase